MENTDAGKEAFWNDRYEREDTGWDMSQVSPPLKSYIDSIKDKEVSLLIPGCGNAYEAQYLLDEGFTNVTILDISSFLVERLKEQFKGRQIEILQGDFFQHKGKYDLVLEQTFFCALDPSLRNKYVEKMHEILDEKGRLTGLLFNKHFGFDHPPYGGSEEEYLQLFEPHFVILKMERCYNSISPRAGSELFIEMEKK